MMAPDEATSIALHFVNAQKEGQLIEETMKVTRIVQDILEHRPFHFGVAFDEDRFPIIVSTPICSTCATGRHGEVFHAIWTPSYWSK